MKIVDHIPCQITIGDCNFEDLQDVLNKFPTSSFGFQIVYNEISKQLTVSGTQKLIKKIKDIFDL